MAQDNSNYQIVQISESDWAIQYSDGSIISGYASRQIAIDVAIDIAENTPIEIETQVEPRNLDEALVRAQDARDEYRQYLSSNPTTTQEQKDAHEVKIMQADARVSEYQAQMSQANTKVEKKETWSASQEITRQNAQNARNEAATEATQARKNGASPSDIEKADQKAFQTESY